MADAEPERPGDGGLNEKLLDALVYVPAGLALSVVEEFPRLAALGRDRLGVRVSSARAVGQFAVKAGHDEFVRRSDGWFHRSAPPAPGTPAPARPSSAPASPPVDGSGSTDPATVGAPSGGEGVATGAAPAANGHVPAVATLAIPGFDALSASQVVQRLDGLNRSELVSVRAYEASTRGRRTILSRVDQLLDERS
jgi:hypothetical protein